MTHSTDDVGSLGEEAAKLVSAVQDWAHRLSERAPIATESPECQWCPVCQLISAARDRPDLAEKAGETARTVVASLLAAFGGPHSHASGPSGPEAGPTSKPEDRANGRRVERINLLGEDPIDGLGGESG